MAYVEVVAQSTSHRIARASMSSPPVNRAGSVDGIPLMAAAEVSASAVSFQKQDHDWGEVVSEVDLMTMAPLAPRHASR